MPQHAHPMQKPKNNTCVDNTTQNTGNIMICFITKAEALHNWRPSSLSGTTGIVLKFQE
jgi:hypothetical protein